MASVIRYTEYTNAEAIGSEDKQGIEAALMAFKVTLPTLNATQNANIFTLKGAGKIKCVVSVDIRKAAGAVRVEDITGGNRASILTIAADSRTINLAIPANGVAVEATDTCSLLLVVGA